MAYRSNWTGLQVDKGVYNSVDGPRFVTTGVIDLSKVGVSSVTEESQDLLDIYNFVLNEQSLTQDITNKCISVIKAENYLDATSNLQSTVISNGYVFKTGRYDSQGHESYKIGVTFKIGEYSYNLYTFSDLDNHSKYSNWNLDKSSVEYISVESEFLNKIVNEIDVSSLINYLSNNPPSFRDLENLLLYSPVIYLNATSNSGVTLDTNGLRISVIGAYKTLNNTRYVTKILLSYSKKDYSATGASINEIGGCSIEFSYNIIGSLGLVATINYLPTLGFE